jgi:hypothetical protein
MKRTICDECGRGIPGEEISLKGYQGRHGGILLPERLKEFDFCSNKCLERWIFGAITAGHIQAAIDNGTLVVR